MNRMRKHNPDSHPREEKQVTHGDQSLDPGHPEEFHSRHLQGSQRLTTLQKIRGLLQRYTITKNVEIKLPDLYINQSEQLKMRF